MAENIRKIESFSLIGAGKLGSNLAYSLKKSGIRLNYIYKKSDFGYFRSFLEDNIEKIVAESDAVFIATGESSIGDLAKKISDNSDPSGKIFFHTSNSLTSDELIPLKKKGAHIASLSPLQTFVEFEKDKSVFSGVYFLAEGSATALSHAELLVSMLKGKIIRVKKNEKVFFHIAAVSASNLLISLLRFSTGQLKKTKYSNGIEPLIPLIKKTVSNIEKRGVLKSLSGPVERGEMKIVKMHLEKLKGREREIYELLTQMLIFDGSDISPE